MSALARPNALTLAHADISLAKHITVIDGVVTRTDDPPWPRILTFETVEVRSPDDLLDVLRSAADQNPAPCVVRGEPLTEFGRSAIYDDPKEGPAGLRIMPRTWVGYDIEKVPAGGIDPLHEPERAVAKVRRCLAPPHHDASVVWQLTASAGKRANELRLRLWFLLDHPMRGRQVEAWCKPGIDSRWLDPCTLRNEVLPHFIGVKIVGTSPDPCPCRWGLIRGERNAVALPDSVLALPERMADGAALDLGGDLAVLEERYGLRLDERRQAAVARIKDEIRAVRAAGDGHRTYLHAAATIEGLCEFWCIPIAKPRELVEAAYLSTLKPDEARKRERGSTKGVWRWLGRRAPR
jgi:hypothetical protein